MATLKLVLSKSQHQKKTKSKESLLMLRYTHQKKVVYFSMQKNLEDSYWDAKKQCVKRSYKGFSHFNIYLDKRKQKIEDIVNKLLIEEKNPTTQLVKSIDNESKLERQKKNTYSFKEFIHYYIDSCKKRKSIGTIKTYITTLNKIEQYEKYARRLLDWNDINMDFYHDFKEFYTGVQGYTNNGHGRVIKILKVFLNEATDKGYNTCLDYKSKHFKTTKEEVNNIYLNEKELDTLLKLNLSFNKSLERIRDLFIVGCYTGLRFSDFTQIKPEHIFEDRIRIKTLKTNEWVTIPLHPVVKSVMSKYSHNANSLPKSCQNQTMNKHLKEIGRLAGIDESILKIRNRGKERIEEVFPKYRLITTHPARRSFATNAFKMKVPSRVIMKITGHRTEQAFNSYIKITQDENADLMLDLWNKSA